MNPMSRTATAEIPKSINVEAGTVRSLISSGELATDQIIILPSAWERHLTRYRDNPVLLWGHDMSCDARPSVVVGRAVRVWTDDDGLWADFEIARGTSADADTVWRLLLGGFLRAFSVSWIPKRVVTMQSELADLDALPAYARDALVSGRARAVHSEAELLETSFVPVPADAHAVARSAGVEAVGAVREIQSRMEEIRACFSERLDSIERTLGKVAEAVKRAEPVPEPTLDELLAKYLSE